MVSQVVNQPSINPSIILVTGGTGFLGRALMQKLLSNGHSVRVFSRGGERPEHPKVTMFRGSLTCLKDLKLAMQGCTAVFHCAGEKNDPKQMVHANIYATRLLFDVAAEFQVKLFCHLSSVGVIGKTDRKIIDELTPCNPMNLYEETKYMAEEVVSQGNDGGKVVILRPTNIFGTETLQPWLNNSLCSRMRLMLKGRENAHLVYVKDVAAAATYLLLNAPPDKPVDTYNVSSDEEMGNTYREVRACLVSGCKTGSTPFAISAPLCVPYYVRLIKNGNTNRGDLIYSCQKLLDTGFRFPFGLRKGLDDSVNALSDLPTFNIRRDLV
jgi:nucleoside-diphosphate-sugar epimerase